MQCENHFCIYCNHNQCLLGHISINEVGMCMECIPINPDERVLKSEKQKLLTQYEKRSGDGK